VGGIKRLRDLPTIFHESSIDEHPDRCSTNTT
jgi:hypothetical protein